MYEESVLKDQESSIVCFPSEAEIGKLIGSHYDNTTLWCLVRYAESNEICVWKDGSFSHIMRFIAGSINDFDYLKFVYLTVQEGKIFKYSLPEEPGHYVDLQPERGFGWQWSEFSLV